MKIAHQLFFRVLCLHLAVASGLQNPIKKYILHPFAASWLLNLKASPQAATICSVGSAQRSKTRFFATKSRTWIRKWRRGRRGNEGRPALALSRSGKVCRKIRSAKISCSRPFLLLFAKNSCPGPPSWAAFSFPFLQEPNGGGSKIEEPQGKKKKKKGWRTMEGNH